jgi:hypothetical protein
MSKRSGGKKKSSKRGSKRQKVNMSQYVKKSDVETKYFHQDYVTVAYPSAGGLTSSWAAAIGTPTGINSVFVPQRGTGYAERIGRSVNLTKINIRGMIDCPPDITAAQGVAPFVRMVLAVLIGAKGQQPLPANLMTDNGVFAVMDPDHFGEWKILKDIIIEIPSLATTSNQLGTFNTEGITIPFHMVHKFKTPMKVQFTNLSAGDFGDIEMNNVCLWSMVSNTTYGPRLTYHSVCSFKDS